MSLLAGSFYRSVTLGSLLLCSKTVDSKLRCVSIIERLFKRRCRCLFSSHQRKITWMFELYNRIMHLPVVIGGGGGGGDFWSLPLLLFDRFYFKPVHGNGATCRGGHKLQTIPMSWAPMNKWFGAVVVVVAVVAAPSMILKPANANGLTFERARRQS